ncbi:MAG: ribosomal-processing cysteine protease Prp [Eubacteriaceae bacterium]|nr:ribosomal-processing cysteine protease Prp [Eubacteriaceae bacterium]
MIKSLVVSGHSGYDEIGKDIVCASVSSLTIAAVNGLIEYVKLDFYYKVNEDGFLEFRIPEIYDEKQFIRAKAILETLYLGLKSIENEYKSFVNVVG